MAIEYRRLFTIVLAGSQSSGKSKLFLRGSGFGYDETDYQTTIGVDFRSFSARVEDTHVKVNLWDTAGHSRFLNIVQSYFRGAAACVVVYSVTDRSSFEAVEGWVKIIQLHSYNALTFIVGNKSDCQDRQVTFEEAKELADRVGLSYIEVSAKTGANVDIAFKLMLTTLIKIEEAN
mmetsp:Transcript_21929/g.40007  ORF Transcript_21929/g.40007 Transcript_21929/m.40007 type:complete len:176 (+) Transcript_21929:4418-4945(+)